jgi:hypothetical protein
MKRIVLVCILLLAATTLSVQPVHAQPVTTANHLAWDQPGPDLLTVQTYGWNLYADAATTGVVLAGPVISGTVSPFQVVAPFPAFAPGTHTVSVSAFDLSGESPKSNVISFQFVVIPLSPVNLRITAERFFKGLGGMLVKFMG